MVTGIVPSFRGTDSYLAFPNLNPYLAFNIEIRFKPEMADGTYNFFFYYLPITVDYIIAIELIDIFSFAVQRCQSF